MPEPKKLSGKEGPVGIFWDMKRHMTIDILERSSTINNAYLLPTF